ncbi:D-aminoacyl-tRNA deacylase-like isoform X1 [Anopheles funestus]|uniref:D-aminoacyl-tRNA deacylase-like isoform X1 n=1 Tax=Anopheles funestus TaxID=62324 RepID=UPI0020C7358F|nr:D-aminoacyl-tRNA deacylase-like isoform X1 [Anopheles funestus]
MKAITQRVNSAKVMAGDETVSSIGRGLCMLVGISSDNDANDIDWKWVGNRKISFIPVHGAVMCSLKFRLLIAHESSSIYGCSMRQLPETGGQNRWLHLEILCVSLIALYHRSKGNRPDFSRAMQ